MNLPAPAKINLFLRVGPAGGDGFHPLASWMVTVGLADELTFGPSDAPGVRLSCDDPAVPTDGRNLVLRAADALARRAGIDPPGTSIALAKRVPTGGGLGGGSSDAATTLVALNDLWDLRLPAAELHHLASSLGSDVAFFLYPPSALCTGRGEVVAPIPPPRPRSAVLILPPIAVPTPAVYRRLDERAAATSATVPPGFAGTPPAEWATWAVDDLLARLVNDLEAPAFDLHPALGELRARAERLLARPARLSGSGGTLFTLYDDPAEAVRAAGHVVDGLSIRAIAVDLAPPADRTISPSAGLTCRRGEG